MGLPVLTCEFRTISQFDETRQDKWGKPLDGTETFHETSGMGTIQLAPDEA